MAIPQYHLRRCSRGTSNVTRPTLPIRLAILVDPKSNQLGVGPLAVEQLLGIWLGSPVVLGHQQDGTVLITGASGHHAALGHASGVTAVALASRPVGLHLASVPLKSADRHANLQRIQPHERSWLGTLPPELREAALAQIVALRQAVIGRDRSGWRGVSLPDLPDLLTPLLHRPAQPTLVWRPWAPLETGSSAPASPAGLVLAMPEPVLTRAGSHPAAIAQLASPAGTLALGVAWTANEA